VKIDGNVGGLGSIKHREFAFASGEMSPAQFTSFLRDTLGNAAAVAKDGASAYVCMDWRHMRELQDVGAEVFSELKNLCVWNKSNGGMGTFYRSKHELIFVYKVGTRPTPTVLAWEKPDAIGPMSGTTPASAAWAPTGQTP
jgi:DNA methylase